MNSFLHGRWLVAGVLAGLLAAGCGEPACDEISSKRFAVETRLYQSATSVDQWFAGTVTGTVTEVNTGVFGPKEDNGACVVFEDANAVSWTACYTGEGPSMPLAVGDEVTAERQLMTPDISEASSALTLRVGGKLAVFAVSAFDPGIKSPPEIAFANGDLLCATPIGSATCGAEGYELVATAGGTEVRMKPGEVATVEGLEVHMGWWGRRTSDGACDGGQVSHHVFVVPAP